MVAIPGTSLAQLGVDNRRTLPVAEVFGPTIQGEGPHLGRRCWFLRLGECNLHCSWCDTKFTWDWANHDRAQELRDQDAATIADRLIQAGARNGSVVVVTGGEPLIHHNRPPFRALVGRSGPPFAWHLESNGTIWPGDECALAFAHVTLSPKIGQSDDPEKRRLPVRSMTRWAEHSRHTGNVAWKFVVRDGYDVGVVREFVDLYGIAAEDVWCMAEGTTPWHLLQRQAALADGIVAAGFNLTTRLHVLAWPNEAKGR